MGVRLIFAFAVCFAVFTIAPALLLQPLAADGFLRVGDALDILSPIVLVTCFYLLFRSADDWASDPATGPMIALFLVAAVLFIEGRAIHLAASAIRPLLADVSSSPAGAARFYYSAFSQYLWHVGTLGIATLLLWRHYQPVKRGADVWQMHRSRQVILVLAGLIYGGTLALMALEGGTALFDLSAAALIAAFFLLCWWRQRQVPGSPVVSFLGLGYLTTAVLLGSWGIYRSGFPAIGWLR